MASRRTSPAVRGGLGVQEKLEILSEASQYDLACACGTNDQDRRRRSSDGTWLYPVPLPRGGRSVLLKTLLSNVCTNDCKYCPCRTGTDIRRCTLAPDEVAATFLDYLRSGHVHGLFLSSGVVGDPDSTMGLLTGTARRLRRDHGFRGYIHLKVLPGASDAAVEDAVSVASAVSLNIETPGERHFAQLSTTKRYLEDIIRPMKLIHDLTGPGAPFSRVKQTTQFVVGAGEETDAEIVKYTAALYERLRLQRVYFSAYQRGVGADDLPGEEISPPGLLAREHRLYQVDFLLRKYGFGASEIGFDAEGNLPLGQDPKQAWAERHPEFFPVRINAAAREDLLRVPGLGPVSADRIVRLRRAGRLRGPEDIGVRGTRREKILEYAVFE